MLPASIVLGVAIFMFLIGLLGCIAVFKESKILLSAYFCLILIVFVGEVIASVLGYCYRSEVEDTVSTGLMDAVNKYNETVMAEQVDYIQRELKCCGVRNATDWLTSLYWGQLHNNTVPSSCCNTTVNHNITICDPTITSGDIYTMGCLYALKDKFMSNLIYIAVCTVSFAVVQILGLITVCILICRTREVKYDRLENAQRDGLRV